MADYIAHHGIKGMRWGVRRFQNKDGTRTPAGKKRESIIDRMRDKAKAHSERRRIGIETEFRKAGYTEAEAAAATKRRLRTEKILLAVGAVALTAAIGTYAYKHHRNEVDHIIKAGTKLQRIEMQDTAGKLHDVFYAAHTPQDKTKYAGYLGAHRIRQTGHAYKMAIGVQNDLKIAGDKNARKIFKELYDKDPDIQRAVKAAGGVFGGKAANVNSTKGLYDRFNQALVLKGPQYETAQKKFYDALKKAGYAGLQDVNDKRYSGYKAQMPIIYLNDGKNFVVNSMQEMKREEVNKAMGKTLAIESGKAMAEKVVTRGGAASLGLGLLMRTTDREYTNANTNADGTLSARAQRQLARKKKH